MGDHQMTLAQRLASKKYDRQEVLQALRGQRLPTHLGYALIKLCIIRGILHVPSFAQGAAAILRGLPDHPQYTRALNARAIMSNHLPDMDPVTRPEELPYCIWYPDVASEDTYRKLAERYPQMRYQVARSCAVAGYTQLFLDLEHVLPEVAVAEDARDAGSHAIFTHIMEQPVQYKVFDDYQRTISPDNPLPACLNGDTCVVSTIKDQKQAFLTPADPDDWMEMLIDGPGFTEMRYNITEDQGVQESALKPWEKTYSSADLMLDLFTSPLPTHLPAGNKDMLVRTAAFYGDIDRYARLRRPKPTHTDVVFIVRGIYHNSLFALWWSRQRNSPEGEPSHMRNWHNIQQAITARHIMNNDLSRILSRKDDYMDLPYLIWYPDIARHETYLALAHRMPQMREACVRAAIYAGYVEVFDEILLLPGVVPNVYLHTEAKHSSNPHFMSALQSRAKDLGLDNWSDPRGHHPWKKISVREIAFLRKSNHLVPSPHMGLAYGDFIDQGAVYNETISHTDGLDLYLMVPESWRPEKRSVELDYKDWPPNW
ncbi:hypothetical protein S40293_10040 [Stachybotrys chartarum IBT 40293]|nr:hypothetical protein S40293_10040 [Stachybotrys chartarum IBT 40293]